MIAYLQSILVPFCRFGAELGWNCEKENDTKLFLELAWNLLINKSGQ